MIIYSDQTYLERYTLAQRAKNNHLIGPPPAHLTLLLERFLPLPFYDHADRFVLVKDAHVSVFPPTQFITLE